MAQTNFKLALLQWVILPVFILRALIPAGFMPDLNRDHATMTICSGYEAKQVPAQHEGKAKGDHLPCGFSFTSVGPLTEASTITPSENLAAVVPQRRDDVLVMRVSHGYQSQAPPIV